MQDSPTGTKKVDVKVNHTYELVVNDRGPCGVLFSVKFDDDESSELDRFLCDSAIEEHPEFYELLAMLELMMDKIGFDPKYFRTDGYPAGVGYLRYYDPVRMIPVTTLRLYCAPLRDHFVIGGGGCIKTTITAGETPECASSLDRIVAVVEDLDASRKRGDVEFTDWGPEPEPITGSVRL